MTTTNSIVTLVPTYFYLSVDYTDGLTGQAARESYKGLSVRVEYNGGERTAPGPRPEQKVKFNSGDFARDYDEALDFIAVINRDEAPVMASSSVDSFMFDAGYEALEDAADLAAAPSVWHDAEIPFATDVDLARDQYEATIAADLPFLPQTDAERVVAVAKTLERAWGRVPAAKLQWALANVIASSDYNTEYPRSPMGRVRALDALKVLDGLMADATVAAARR